MDQVEAQARWSKSIDAAVLVSLAVGWLYFCGSLYFNAFHRELGSIEFVSTPEFNEFVMRGLGTVLIAGTPVVVLLVLIVEVALAVAMLVALISGIGRIQAAVSGTRKAFSEIRVEGDSPALKRLSLVSEFGQRLTAPTLVLLMPILFLLGSAWVSENRGRKDAEEMKRALVSGRAAFEVLFLSNGRKVTLGPRIGCSTEECVYLAKDGIVVFRRDLIMAHATHR